MTFSATQEDYLETIWELTKKQGYVRVTDVAQALGIQRSSVSRMIQRLAGDGILDYRRYRGFRMTPEGYKYGQAMYERRRVLQALFDRLELGHTKTNDQALQGIEHFVPEEVLLRVKQLIEFIELRPEWWDEYNTWRAQRSGLDCHGD